MNLNLYQDVTSDRGYSLCFTNFLYLCINKKINITTHGVNIISGTLIDYSEFLIKLKNNEKYIYILKNTIIAIEIEDDIMGYGE